MLNGKNNLEVGLKTFAGLLDEFREANICDKKDECKSINKHLRDLSRRWSQQFPGLPENYFPYSSAIGVSRRSVRDKYLNEIIVKQFKTQEQNDRNRTILNPACVFGRHARYLASRLENFKVVGTDINPVYNRFYEYICKTPDNYEFIQDDIFKPTVKILPLAVVFFGACGSLTDAAMDYAIGTNCPYLICRTCCHDNIGGNTAIVKRFTALNWASRFKNFNHSRRRRKGKGDYFSDKYSKEQYPRSKAARALSNS